MAGRTTNRRMVSLLACLVTIGQGWAGWQGVLRFSADWAAFREDEGKTRLEFTYAIPYDQLSGYVVDEGRLTARYVVGFEIRGLENGYCETGTFGRRASVRSFAEAEAARRSFVDQFSVAVPAGKYAYRITVAESSNDAQATHAVRVGTIIDTVELSGFLSGMSMSSLQLGVDVLADTVTGDYALVPNPERRYGSTGRGGNVTVEAADRVLVYFECYNLVPDTVPCEIRCFVLRGRGPVDTVIAAPPLRRAKSGGAVASVIGVSVDGLDTGDYVLAVELVDITSGASVVGTKEFTLGDRRTKVQDQTPYRLDVGELERKYYREVSFVATPRELAYYNALPDSGKEAWLAAFWSRRSLTEFARRMELAKTRYATGRTAGTRTDRGRVYIKYGEPDAVEQKTIEMEMKPREYWYYYQQGLAFVFVDLRGDGDFRLVYTNSPDEPKTGLESLLTSEEQDQFK